MVTTIMTVLAIPIRIGAQASAVSLATITTDTGAFAPGNRDFRRYTTPGWCRGAAIQVRDVLRGSPVARAILDTLVDMQQDTVGVQAVAIIARSCGTHFTVAGTAVQDLPDLFELALLAQNDTLARAILARQVSLATTATERNFVQLGAFHAVLAATPTRIALAESILASLDTLKPTGIFVRLQGEVALLGALNPWTDARRIGRVADHIIALVHAHLTTPQVDSAAGAFLRIVYGVRLMAAVTAPDSLAAIVQEAQADPRMSAALADTSFPHWPLEAVIATLAMNRQLNENEHIIGQPASRLRAQFWFPPDGSASDTVQPVRDRVSLFVLGSLDNLDCVLAEPPPLGPPCFPVMASRIRQWLARYGAAGLTITIVQQYSGANNLYGWLTPAEEAEHLRWFFQEYWHLPVTVALQVPEWATLPLPDGRRYITTPTQIGRWPWRVTGDVVLIGRNGTVLAIRRTLGATPTAAARFDALLDWAIRSPAAVLAPTEEAPPAQATGARPTPSRALQQ